MTGTTTKKIPSASTYGQATLNQIRRQLFGQATLTLIPRNMQDEQRMSISLNDEILITVIDRLNPYYVEEFGMTLDTYSTAAASVIKMRQYREEEMLKRAMKTINAGLILDAEGRPSIPYGANPPSRIRIDSATALC